MAASLKSKLIGLIEGCAASGKGPFERWANLPPRSPWTVKKMKRAQLRAAFVDAYGGQDVISALAGAGLSKFYVKDLSKVLGEGFAGGLAAEFDPSRKRSAKAKPERERLAAITPLQWVYCATGAFWLLVAVVKLWALVAPLLLIASLLAMLLWANRGAAFRLVGVCGVVAFILDLAIFSIQDHVLQNRKDAKEAAQQAQEDAAGAQRMGVPVAVYSRAARKKIDAWVDCKSAVEREAAWSASSDFLPSYSWSVDGDSIRIDGDDVKMKNGFGGERHIHYACRYTISTEDVQVLSVN